MPTCLKTQGQIEAEVSDGISKFHQEFVGRGPKEVRTHLVGSLVLARLSGSMTNAERRLAEMDGRDLIKQVRTHMIVMGRGILEGIVERATDCRLVSVHHDISTVTGEEVIVFSLDGLPPTR